MGDEVGDVDVVGMLRLDAMGMCASLEVEPLVFWLYIWDSYMCGKRCWGWIRFGLSVADGRSVSGVLVCWTRRNDMRKVSGELRLYRAEWFVV